MERTVKPAGKLQWRKIGGGSLRIFPNKIIKPNERFFAFPHEIPDAFRDTVICLDEQRLNEQEQKARKELEKPEQLFTLKHKGGGKYDIVDEDGKALNEKSLKKAEAEELLIALQ